MAQATLIDQDIPLIALATLEPEESRLGTVLSVSPFADDHDFLERVVGAVPFRLSRAWTLPAAETFLASNRASVVICERELGTATWQGLLLSAAASTYPPAIIVSSRVVDESFWMDALTAGAYDVLPKPFEEDEVLRIVILASRYWHGPRDVITATLPHSRLRKRVPL